MKKVTIYTDGGAMPNPGVGGWAAILRFGEHVKELSGGEAHTTNNRMELTAAIEALRALKEACEVDFYTDSQYLQKGISEWMAGWLKKGRLAPDSKNPVLNADLWQALHAESQRHRIRWHWVKGHDGNPDNERADQLAGAEIQKRG